MHLLPILILLALLLLCAFFAGGELALMTLDRVGMETAARKGSRRAKLQLQLRSRPQRFLGTILIGYNIANVALTFYAATVTADLAKASGMPEHLALLLGGGVITITLIIFGELIPKTFAALNAPRFAAFATYPLYYLSIVLTPLNIAIDLLATPIVRLLAGGKLEHEHIMGREELTTAIRLARASGQLHSMDSRVAAEALEFSQKDLRDVMTPRVDMIALADSCMLGEALMLMGQHGFTRLPVFHETVDEVVGVLLLKDIVRESMKSAEAGRDPADLWATEPVTPLMRPVAAFPDSKSIVEALAELRQDRAHMAIVVDEHGGTAGIVTLEDILEELVGDIRDEFDTEQQVDVVRRTPDFAIVSGRARIEQLPELERVDLSDVEANTIGGLLMEKLGRRVRVGDELVLPTGEVEGEKGAGSGVKISALKVLGNSVKLLKIERAGKTEES